MNSIITITKDNNILNIKLPSVLDRNNSFDASKQINENLSEDIKSIVFEAKDLRYISADGLDVILELKKKYKDIVIDNACIGICDTLESYGFDNFVNHPLTKD